MSATFARVLRLGLLALSLVGCRSGCSSSSLERRSQELNGGGSVNADKNGGDSYWLVDADVLDPKTGSVVLHVEGPTVVKVGTDGTVTGQMPEGGGFSGTLSLPVRNGTIDGSGLFLYAQRKSPVYFDQAGTHQAGWIHPGAFISVASKADDSLVQIGSLPFGPRQLYVGRHALGAKSGELNYIPPHHSIARRLPADILLTNLNQKILTPPCWDVFFLEENSRKAIVSIRGIELNGFADYDPRGLSDIKIHSYGRCDARVVIKQGAGLMLHEPPTRASDGTRRIAQVPEDYISGPFGHSDLLSQLATGREVYWLTGTETELICERWRFRRNPAHSHTLTGTLKKMSPTSKGDPRLSFPYEYEANGLGGRPIMRFGTLERNGEPAFRCDCQSEYHALAQHGNELHVTSGQLPNETVRPTSRLVAYHKSDFERWFLELDDCDQALLHAKQVIQKWPYKSTLLGIHPRDR